MILSALIISLSSCVFINKGKYIASYEYEQRAVNQISYYDVKETTGLNVIPSTGTYNVLVLPIEFSDKSFPSNYKDCLNRAYNGSADPTSSLYTGYSESVKSFYYKSSYGKLNVNFIIADKYEMVVSAKSWYSSNNSSLPSSYDSSSVKDSGVNAIGRAYEAYKQNNDVLSLDSDADGYIDGIIGIYSSDDYNTGAYWWDEDGYYWAYVYYASAFVTPYSNANTANPGFNLYSFISYDFLFKATTSPSVDYHTYAHEFGHMLGLDDYYASDYSDFNPMGGIVMEDFNICDHDMFTKTVLGWTTPTSGNVDGEITLSSSTESGDCILIPSGNWNGTAFDEYILVEFYTPTGLNELDSNTKYSLTKGLTDYGIKIYHIDARLVEIRGQSVYWSSIKNQKLNSKYQYLVANTNCNKDTHYGDDEFSLCHQIEANNVFTYSLGGYATNASLFHQGDTFTLKEYSKFFPESNTFNNGYYWKNKIEITSLTSTSATIKISK